MDQWAPDAVQYYGKDHKKRGLNAISQTRADDFKKYRRVEGAYQVVETTQLGNNSVEVKIEYIMNFTKQNGGVISDGTPDKPKQEIYWLTYNPSRQRWLITENDDN